MDYEVVRTEAASKMRVLENKLRGNYHGFQNITQVSQHLQMYLESILDVPVHIAPKNSCNFPSIFSFIGNRHIRIPRCDSEGKYDTSKDILFLLCLGIVLVFCPTNFIDSIDPNSESLYTFSIKYPELILLADSLYGVLSKTP